MTQTNYDILKEYEEHQEPIPTYEEWQQLKKFCEEFNALEVVKENEKLEKQLSIAKKAINGAARRIKQLASSTALNYLERAKKKIKKIDEVLK